LSSHPLWIANFSSTATQPAVPHSWGTGNWLFWQFTDTTHGVVPGGDGADLDRFHVLSAGAKNTEVRRVQQWLHDTSVKRADAALDPKGINGTFGPDTAAAVRRLQTIDVNPAGAPPRANLGPLPQTGVVDVVTWAKLLWA
jgi:peptidoglycan hydrolase-like protein with peptidoglycan-binding domain